MKEFARQFMFGECWCLTAPASVISVLATCYWFGAYSLLVGFGVMVILRTIMAFAYLDEPKSEEKEKTISSVSFVVTQRGAESSVGKVGVGSK